MEFTRGALPHCKNLLQMQSYDITLSPDSVAKGLPGPRAGCAVLYNAPPTWRVGKVKWLYKGHRNQWQNVGGTH